MKCFFVTLLCTILLIAGEAEARQNNLTNVIHYNQKAVKKGSTDIIQSQQFNIWVGAYRLMNGLGLPDATLDSSYRHSYQPHNKRYSWRSNEEWQKKSEGILGSSTTRTYCGPCASYALELLEERIDKLGINHPYVVEWVRNQDKVLQNHRSKSAQYIPEPVTHQPDDNTNIQTMRTHDRAYQTASAYFYNAHYAQAYSHYQIIANDPQSPYQAKAHYMLARTLYSQEEYQAAMDKIQEIIADPSLASVHQDARDFIGIVTVRSDDPTLQHIYFEKMFEPFYQPIKTKEDEAWLTTAIPQHNREMWFVLGSSYAQDLKAGLTTFQESDDLMDWITIFTMPGSYMGNNHWLDQKSDIKHNRESLAKAYEYRKYQCDNYQYCRFIKPEEALAHSLQKWQETQKIHWLLHVIMRLGQGHDATDDVLTTYSDIETRYKAGNASEAETYAFPTLAYHAARLLVYKNEHDRVRDFILEAQETQKQYAPAMAFQAARYWISIGEMATAEKVIDKMLTQKAFLNTRPFLMLKLLYASSLDDVLKIQKQFDEYEPYYYQSRYSLGHSNFVDTIAHYLNLLPVKQLEKLLQGGEFTQGQRTETAAVLFTRGVLLEDTALIKKMIPQLKKLLPKLTDYLNAYEQETDAHKKQLKLLHLMLKTPRLKPYFAVGYEPDFFEKDQQQLGTLHAIDTFNHNDNNWWCGYEVKDRHNKAKQALLRGVPPKHLWGYTYRYWRYGLDIVPYGKKNDPIRQAFFKSYGPFSLIDDEELLKLNAAGAAPSYLAKQVVQWPKETSWFSRLFKKEDDALLAETLYLAVRATRYGCEQDKDKGTYSQKAFKMLHTKYPQSEWAFKTPYWFR